MNATPRIPIRLKILVSVLFIVTGVVSVITFTMANMFHQDKRVYITDLVSAVTLNTAAECSSLLVGYGERLRVYARIMGDRELTSREKASLIEGLFAEFPELIAIYVHDAGEEIAAAYNADALAAAALSKEAVAASRQQLQPEIATLRGDQLFARNATLTEQLPSMLLATVTRPQKGRGALTISALIRLDTLMRVADRTGGFEIFVADSAGTLLAHSDPSRVARRQAAVLMLDVDDLRDERSAGLTVEFERDDVKLIGAYAGVGLADVIAGAEIPASAAFLASRDLLRRLLLIALALLVAAAFVGLVWAHRITRPVERLSGATREVAKGRFDVQVRVKSRDEIGTLASSFNQMASELDRREKALTEAQGQLIQSEKMAAFGQLGAGIAHEVKNPLAGILGCAQLALRKAERDTSVHQNLQLIEKETRRCKTIIENLLKFARQEKTVLQSIAVNPVVEDATAIVHHQLELSKVKLETELAADLPNIRGNANQLQQVLMNLLLNAQQAMEGRPGTVQVLTRRGDAGTVEIVVRDDGPGMTEEVRSKLFEPFFTTKPGGKGTGLGLSVSFGIVKDHAGEITVDSTNGNGATFTIRIPALAEEERPAASTAAAETAEPVAHG